MPYPELDTERMELLAVIHPDLHQGTYYTPWIAMQGRHKALAVLLVGDIGQGGTVDLELVKGIIRKHFPDSRAP